MEGFTLVLSLLSGVALFLFGMSLMGDGLKKAAGNKLELILYRLTNTPLKGILLGTAVTAIIQSSSATTVMVVGFVNAGMMKVSQAIGIIMGANIGTTITAWVVSMSEWGSILKPEFFAPLLIGIGAFLVLFSKKEKPRELSEILIGFGLLFIGLSFMSGAITPYRDAPVLSRLTTGKLAGLLTGLSITAVIQSSSASVGILQTLAANGVVTWNSAIYITLGQNIGTCVTALLSSLGAHRTARRAAVIHLLFNVMGAVLFGGIMFGLFSLNRTWAAASINSVQISVFHTVFNVTNTIILFPFANWLVKMSGILVKGEEEEEPEEAASMQLPHLDERILETPSFAVEYAAKEVVRMGELSWQHAKLVFEAVRTGSQKRVDKAYQIEETMNKYERQIAEYLAKISKTSLTDHQRLVVGNLLYTVGDIERMSDHCDNIAEMAERMIRERQTFSLEAIEGLQEIESLALDSMKASILARQTEKMAYVQQTIQIEDEIDDLEEELREKHIERLARNQCSAAKGVIYLDILNNIERISDHADNIAGYVADEIQQ